MAEKILIVDDDIDSLKLIGLMLQRQGYEVLAANAGKPALAKAEAEHPHLIILDVMMPDMSGLEVCKRLRNNAQTAEIPIIMFTAKTLIDDKVKGFEAGADDYLTKPTHPAELASRVKAVLARNTGGVEHDVARPASARGEVIGILGAKGGVGTSTVALNIGAALQQAGENAVVADFRLGAGTLGMSMGLTRSQGMARLFSRPMSDINPTSVSNEVVTHESGLRLMLSSIRASESEIEQKPDQARAIVNALREVGKPVVVDMGAGITPITTALISQMNEVIVLVEPNPITVAMAKDLIKYLESHISRDHINIAVVNRTQTALQTPWHEIESQLGHEVLAIISAATELFYQSVENQTAAVLLQPNSVVGGQLTKLADEIKARIRPTR
ncbi:MAG: response regulator [Anaerolineae bacterium]|nr:response regulator [Anaerolineae bacterium]MCB9460013.1 response regulator [Anaerolineaceae bacterium]